MVVVALQLLNFEVITGTFVGLDCVMFPKGLTEV